MHRKFWRTYTPIREEQEECVSKQERDSRGTKKLPPSRTWNSPCEGFKVLMIVYKLPSLPLPIPRLKSTPWEPRGHEKGNHSTRERQRKVVNYLYMQFELSIIHCNCTNNGSMHGLIIRHVPVAHMHDVICHATGSGGEFKHPSLSFGCSRVVMGWA